MASFHYALSLAAILLILHSQYVTANFTIPFLSPFFGNACKENVCGRGNCVVSNSSTFGFECQCEAGWKQALHEDDDDQNFRFLPCVIPNCTLNYTCENAPSPAPAHGNRANMSFFDPCFWTDCGGGRCNKTSDFSHTCLCEEGYYNLFNSTAFPCYRQCALGADCANLGLGLTNSSTSSRSPNSTIADESNSKAASLISGIEFALFSTMVTTMALVLCKDA